MADHTPAREFERTIRRRIRWIVTAPASVIGVIAFVVVDPQDVGDVLAAWLLAISSGFLGAAAAIPLTARYSMEEALDAIHGAFGDSRSTADAKPVETRMARLDRTAKTYPDAVELLRGLVVPIAVAVVTFCATVIVALLR